MQIELNRIEFNIAANTFNDAIKDKAQYLSKIETVFLRKYQQRVKLAEYHPEMIYQIRNIVFDIEEIYKDMKAFFIQMNIPFVFQFVRKIQTLMVTGYNHLSQALLVTLDLYQAQKARQKKDFKAKVIEQQCSCKKITRNGKMSREDFRKIEQIDYIVQKLQFQEQQLLKQMQDISTNVLDQKDQLQKLKPSLASKYLQQMKDHIQNVVQKNQKLFDQTYLMRVRQNHSKFQNVKSFQKFEIQNLMNSQNGRRHFFNQILNSAIGIIKKRAFDPAFAHCIQTQTQSFSKKKSQKIIKQPKQVLKQNLSVQKKPISSKQNQLATQIFQLKHLNSTLTEQLGKYKNAQRQIQVRYRQLVTKYIAMQIKCNISVEELDKMKYEESRRVFNVLQQINRKKIKQQLMDEQTNLQSKKKKRQKSFVNNKQIILQNKEVQTSSQFSVLLPTVTEVQVIDTLKRHNQGTIRILGQKDKKIKQSLKIINIMQEQSTKIKQNLNQFVFEIQNHINNEIYKGTRPSTIKPIKQMKCQQISQKVKQLLQLILLNPQIHKLQKVNQSKKQSSFKHQLSQQNKKQYKNQQLNKNNKNQHNNQQQQSNQSQQFNSHQYINNHLQKDGLSKFVDQIKQMSQKSDDPKHQNDKKSSFGQFKNSENIQSVDAVQNLPIRKNNRSKTRRLSVFNMIKAPQKLQNLAPKNQQKQIQTKKTHQQIQTENIDEYLRIDNETQTDQVNFVQKKCPKQQQLNKIKNQQLQKKKLLKIANLESTLKRLSTCKNNQKRQRKDSDLQNFSTQREKNSKKSYIKNSVQKNQNLSFENLKFDIQNTTISNFGNLSSFKSNRNDKNHLFDKTLRKIVPPTSQMYAQQKNQKQSNKKLNNHEKFKIPKRLISQMSEDLKQNPLLAGQLKKLEFTHDLSMASTMAFNIDKSITINGTKSPLTNESIQNSYTQPKATKQDKSQFLLSVRKFYQQRASTQQCPNRRLLQKFNMGKLKSKLQGYEQRQVIAYQNFLQMLQYFGKDRMNNFIMSLNTTKFIQQKQIQTGQKCQQVIQQVN